MSNSNILRCCTLVCFLYARMCAMDQPAAISQLGAFIAQNSDWQNVGWLKEPLARIMRTASQVIQTQKLNPEDTAKTCQHLQQAFQNISITYQCAKDLYQDAQLFARLPEKHWRDDFGRFFATATTQHTLYEPEHTTAWSAMRLTFDYLLDSSITFQSTEALNRYVLGEPRTSLYFSTIEEPLSELEETYKGPVSQVLLDYGRHLHNMATCLQEHHPKFSDFKLKELAVPQLIRDIHDGKHFAGLSADRLNELLVPIFTNRDRTIQSPLLVGNDQFIQTCLSVYCLLLELMNESNKPVRQQPH